MGACRRTLSHAGHRADEHFIVISLSAIMIILSIILSMMQQINYIITWKAIKDAAYESAMPCWLSPSNALMSTCKEFDTIVFLIRESQSCWTRGIFLMVMYPRFLLLQCPITFALVLVKHSTSPCTISKANLVGRWVCGALLGSQGQTC